MHAKHDTLRTRQVQECPAVRQCTEVGRILTVEAVAHAEHVLDVAGHHLLDVCQVLVEFGQIALRAGI